ncbi:MAG TPA: CHRD domain-containing protein [Albitalea sp.]|nr:CHRD domain-containing protein [Albitalea sp.]
MAGTTSRLICAVLAAYAASAAQAQTHNHDDDTARARMSSYQEVPSLSTAASASFTAKVSPGEIRYELTYRGLESDALQAHIHLGQKSVNGGVSVFLCSNLGNGPVGTQACPLRAGTISGTITAANVIGPAGQGIAAGQFDELISAMRAGVTYANVHTATFPGGEVRGQIKLED